jgi:hypothetical protein
MCSKPLCLGCSQNLDAYRGDLGTGQILTARLRIILLFSQDPGAEDTYECDQRVSNRSNSCLNVHLPQRSQMQFVLYCFNRKSAGPSLGATAFVVPRINVHYHSRRCGELCGDVFQSSISNRTNNPSNTGSIASAQVGGDKHSPPLNGTRLCVDNHPTRAELAESEANFDSNSVGQSNRDQVIGRVWSARVIGLP